MRFSLFNNVENNEAKTKQAEAAHTAAKGMVMVKDVLPSFRSVCAARTALQILLSLQDGENDYITR